jgi:uncharacterized protein YjbI with pentapeptide repeats
MDSITLTVKDVLELLKGGHEGIGKWNQQRKNGIPPVDLSECDLEGADLAGADLTHLILTKANFSRANLKSARFCHANVTNSKFHEAEMDGADLTHANLTAADLRDANLTNADLSHADLTGAILVNVKLNGANLEETRFIESDLEGTSLSKARFRSTVIAADLSVADQESLNKAKHPASSHVTFGSVRNFNGNLPKRFLKGCQLDDRIIRLFAHMSENSGEKAEDSMKTIKIFLASSEELREDREEFERYFRQQNDQLREEGLYLEIVRWENFLDAMSETRLQDEYNREVRECDIFVSLFMTKTGKYTEEEFDVAHRAFTENKRPLIYTFFKDAQTSIGDADRETVKSLWRFQDKLKELGHFYTKYDNTEHLKRHFKDQLEKLREKKLL